MTDAVHHIYDDDAEFGDYFALLKPRVMSLVVFTAFVGMCAAPGFVHPIIGLAIVLFIALGAGASGALNMWWDADIDAQMKRTALRPIPKGVITPKAALHFGLWLSGFAIMMLALIANIAAAAMLAFTIFFYAVIYTIWLKRSTPQNIVIGGAAGAFPPVIGWLAATGSLTIEPLLMFAVIFLWTPPHFWSLALFVNPDYKNAQVPMLTVTHGPKATRRLIFVYTLLLGLSALFLTLSSIGGPLSFGVALLLNISFLYRAFLLTKRSEKDSKTDDYSAEKKFFRQSLIYLFVLFGILLIELGLRDIGWGGWGL